MWNNHAALINSCRVRANILPVPMICSIITRVPSSQVAKLGNLVYKTDKDFQISAGSVCFMYPAMTVGNNCIILLGIFS